LGNSTGPFVLNLLLQPPGPAPHVVAVTPETAPDNGALMGVHVRFDEPVNLLPVAFNAFLETQWQDGTLPSVALTGPGGSVAPLRLESYDDATSTANFVLLSGVPAGAYSLVLSGDGPGGIASATGTPLAGNVGLPGEHEFLATFGVSHAASSSTAFTSQPG